MSTKIEELNATTEAALNAIIVDRLETGGRPLLVLVCVSDSEAERTSIRAAVDGRRVLNSEAFTKALVRDLYVVIRRHMNNGIPGVEMAVGADEGRLI